jgi:hypothetical protein
LKLCTVIHSALTFLLRIALAIVGILCIHMNLRIDLYILVKMSLELWWRLHWTYRWLLIVQPFSQYWLCWSMTMECPSIFSYLHWLFSLLWYTQWIIYLFPALLIFVWCWRLKSGPTPSAIPPALFCGGFCQDKVSPTIRPGLNMNRNPPDICFSNS